MLVRVGCLGSCTSKTVGGADIGTASESLDADVKEAVGDASFCCCDWPARLLSIGLLRFLTKLNVLETPLNSWAVGVIGDLIGLSSTLGAAAGGADLGMSREYVLPLA